MPVVNLTPYPIPTGSALLRETAQNAEDTDTFYILDSSKMGEVSRKNNNTYIVSATRHTVYNLEGTTIKGITYYGLIGDNTVMLAQVPPYNNPIIPEGFTRVGYETWDNGFTIQDFNGNQFVWVPALTPVVHADGTLDGTNFNSKFGRRNFRAVSGDIFDSSNFYETNDTTLQNMVESINKYGGFYIAKYEASNNAGKGQSKANTSPWTSINWTDAKVAAETMDSAWGWNTNYVESYLCYGAHWDTVLEWLIDSRAKASAEVINDSTDWGNYNTATFTYGEGATKEQSENTPVNTGANTNPINRHMAKGIYDLAGNFWEWTMESDTTEFYACRGGSYDNNGSLWPAVYRAPIHPTSVYANVSWRSVLYIK